jgi:hypothetical protein
LTVLRRFANVQRQDPIEIVPAHEYVFDVGPPHESEWLSAEPFLFQGQPSATADAEEDARDTQTAKHQ